MRQFIRWTTREKSRRTDKKLNRLAQAYKHAMKRVDRQKSGFRLLAAKVLCWITCAMRPLTTLELQDALAVNIGDSDFDKENLREINDMVCVCCGLVTADEESKIVLLVHYTIQEYFERTWASWFHNAQNLYHTDLCYISIIRYFWCGYLFNKRGGCGNQE